MFLFCNEDRKKKERLNSLLQTTRNLIKNNEIKDVRKNPVYSLIRAMSNYHLYDIVRELYWWHAYAPSSCGRHELAYP